MAAVQVQPRQRDAFMLTPSLTDTRLMQPSPQAAPSTLELSQQEVSRQLGFAEALQTAILTSQVVPCSLQRFRRPLLCLIRTIVAGWSIVS